MARIDNVINGNSSYSKDVTGTSLNKATLKIWIYRGVQGNAVASGVELGANQDRPAEPTYVLSSTAVAYNGTKIASFDIATLIKDYLDPKTSDIYTGDVNVWVDIQVTTETGGVSTIEASEHYLGEDGYYYSTEPQAPTMSSSRISNCDIVKLENSLYKLPIRTSLNPTISFYDNGDGGPSSEVLSSSERSEEQIMYRDIEDDTQVIIIEDGVYGDNVLLNKTLVNDDNWSLQGADYIVNGNIVFLGAAGNRNPTGYVPQHGETYTVTFTISEVTSGFLNGIYDGAGGVNMSGVIDQVGTYSYTYTQTQTGDNKLSFYSATGFSGRLRELSWRKHTNTLPGIDLTENTEWNNPAFGATITGGITDPIGGTNAYRLSHNDYSYITSQGTDAFNTGDEVLTSVWMKGTANGRMRIQELFDDYTNYSLQDLILTSSWQKFEGSAIKGDDNNPTRMVLDLMSSGYIDIYFPQMNRKEPDKVINVVEVCEPKYDPVKLVFVNKMGAFQDLWFFANAKESLKVKSDSWNRRNELGATAITRANKVRNISSITQSITLNSGYYPENNNVVFEELMQSNNVWLVKDGEQVPVTVKDSTFNYKNGITDKGINYTVTLDYAFNRTRSL